MSLSYNPLWDMLDRLEVTKMEFARKTDISNATLAKFSKNEPVTLTTIDKICQEFNCKIENIVEYIPDVIEPVSEDTPLEPGTIVLTQSTLRHPLVKPKYNSVSLEPSLTLPHVILEHQIVQNPRFNANSRQFANPDEVNIHQYIVLPIIERPRPTSTFDYYCKDIITKEGTIKGFIQFSKISIALSKNIESVIGQLSKNTLDDCLEIYKELHPTILNLNHHIRNNYLPYK